MHLFFAKDMLNCLPYLESTGVSMVNRYPHSDPGIRGVLCFSE